jgi:hypothetical protein
VALVKINLKTQNTIFNVYKNQSLLVKSNFLGNAEKQFFYLAEHIIYRNNLNVEETGKIDLRQETSGEIKFFAYSTQYYANLDL